MTEFEQFDYNINIDKNNLIVQACIMPNGLLRFSHNIYDEEIIKPKRCNLVARVYRKGMFFYYRLMLWGWWDAIRYRIVFWTSLINATGYHVLRVFARYKWNHEISTSANSKKTDIRKLWADIKRRTFNQMGREYSNCRFNRHPWLRAR